MSDEIEKLKMHSPDLTQENIAKIRALFPGCVTEAAGEDGKLRLAVDFDQLRQELSDSIVEGPQERYHLNWPGKREALITANAPIAKTLRPARDESVDFDTTQNLFIEGDNLEALKLLQETYLGKVKMIYIDPPYNTGNDFVYDDDFAESSSEFLERSNQKDDEGNRLVANTAANGRFHSDWLNLVAPRLFKARDLLRDDGVIAISIDDNEVANLRKLCDEIFGAGNFVAQNVWQKRYSRENRGVIGDAHEYIVMYARDISSFKEVVNRIGITDAQRKAYSQNDGDGKGPWRGIPMTAQGFRPNQMYEITSPAGVVFTPPTGRCWSMVESEFKRLKEEGRIYFGKNNDSQPSVIRYLSESKGVIPWTWWPHEEVGHTDEARKEIKSLFGTTEVFDTPKPTRLVSRLLTICTNEGDTVLDFFAGSATTAEALLKMNARDANGRKFIMVQLPEPFRGRISDQELSFDNIAEVSKERIRRAGQKTLAGECHPDWNKDVGFRVLKIDSSNMADVFYTPDQTSQADLLSRVDNVKPDRTAEDLLFQVLLDWGVDLTLPIRRETVLGKTVFFVDDTALMACFDDGISEDLVKELAGHAPMRIVFKDTGFSDDQTKINVRQIFKAMSPETEVKAI